MKRLISIGEALIDFVPHQVGCELKEVKDFKGVVGGAPANVGGAYIKLGGPAAMITQLGQDAFGDRIVDEFIGHGIDVSHVLRTDEANTCLAFVSLKEDGNRDFSFYRKPSADMLMNADVVEKSWFEDAYALHFCSLCLGNFPMKEAHRKAISYALECGDMISFDPNIRLPLWKDYDELRRAILEFIPYAHVLKISDEELEFITGKTEVRDAEDILFQGNVQLVLYTKGADGAEAYTKSSSASVPSRKVKAIDTTGAGDAFIGSFLYQLSKDGVTIDTLKDLTDDQLANYLTFSNRYCEYSVLGNGAIASYATAAQFEEYLKK
ncbi:MAG: carbohydrate kinase [Lachnospiraceae bacterium]|nr:carbohydrate kinase [Lachnospiraceae bacterium]